MNDETNKKYWINEKIRKELDYLNLNKNNDLKIALKEIQIENIMESKNPNIKNLLNKNIDFKPLEKIIINYILAVKNNGDYIDLQFDIFWEAIKTFCPKELIEWLEDQIDVNTKSF